MSGAFKHRLNLKSNLKMFCNYIFVEFCNTLVFKGIMYVDES